MKARPQTCVWVWMVAALLWTGALVLRIPFAVGHVGLGQTEFRPPVHLEAAATAAIFGGLRPTMANLAWIQAYGHWERHDIPALEQAVAWALRLAPDNRDFWVQSARMFAYDVPRWEARARLGPGFHPPSALQPFRLEGAWRALAHLEAAAARFPEDPVLEVERALLHLNITGDLESAAAAFRAAWEAPGGPHFAARLHGELLRRLGRPEEALAWYRALLPQLSEDSPVSQHETVRYRIAELEAELSAPRGLPSGQN